MIFVPLSKNHYFFHFRLLQMLETLGSKQLETLGSKTAGNMGSKNRKPLESFLVLADSLMEMYINRYLNDLTNDMIRWTLDQSRSN